MEVEIEATAALFDHVDGWQGRRRVLPMEIEPALEEMPLAEEWVGGGQLLRSGRRLVWRSRGPKLEIAEVPGQVDGHGPRNGMELPFSVLSRDAVCFEEVADSREECLVLWALTRNLVLHAVPFKPPSASGGGHGRGNASHGNSTVASLLAALPTREACDGVALNPPAGSEYPTCCSFVTPRDLLVGYGTGKLQLIRVTRQRGDAGVGVGEGPHVVQAEVVRELPASGYLSYLNPLAYRQAAQPPSSPVVALGGWAASGSELLVFSLHADRKLRVWSTRSSKGVMLSELALPGAVDRGLLYAGCSKVLVHTDAGASCLVVSLTEPSHSRVWVSKPFSSAAEVEGWKDTHLAAHCFEENQLLADVRLVASDDGEEGEKEVAVGARGSLQRGSPQRRPPRPRRLRLWAALANDGLAYAPLETKKGGAGWTSGWGGGGGVQGGEGGPASLIRLWQAPPSGLEDVGLLLGSAAIGGGGEKGQGSGRRDALRQSLLLLYARFGPQWEVTVRHVEASFLRFLAAPSSRFSSMALVKAMERMRSAPSLSGASGRGRGGGGSRRGGHGDGDREPVPTGEQLWEMVTGVVRKEADQALAEAVRQQPRYQQRQQDEEEAGMAEGEKQALALLSAWVHFLDLAEQSREVLSQPLALMGGGELSTKCGASVVAVRVDRCSTAVPIRLPLAHHLTFLDAFEEWMSECAPEATLDVNRCLFEALATTGQLPDPVLLKARATEALKRRRPGKGLDAGLVLRGAGENHQARIELSTGGYQAVEEVEEVLDALRSLLQVLGETKKAPATVRRSSRRSEGGGASASSMEVVSSQDASNSHSSSRPNSLATAALTASAIGEILALCLARLRTSLMLVVHLETAGMQQLLLRGPSEAPLALQVATALNVAWLLYYSASQPLLPPAPIRPPSAVALSATPRAGARALSVLEDLVLDLASSPSSVHAVQEATQALCQGLPRRLLAHLMKAEQYRYLLPWARGLLDGALLLPSTSTSSTEEEASVEEETRRVGTRRWQRLVVYAFLSEARRVSRRVGQANAAEMLFARTIEALEEWDTCLAPPFVDNEEQDEEGGSRDRQDSTDGEGGEDGQVPRLAHYVQAVGLLEQSVGLPGCSPRRLADLAYAGLRHVPAFPDSLGEVDRAQRERLKWCLQHAAALWATVFRACTDHAAAGAWQGTGEEEGSSSSSDALAADAGAFEEAFLAMRAELAVGRDLEELTALGDQEDGEGASGGPVASRRSRNSKLSYLVVEMCERGRIDLVCSLPWAQGDVEDEVSEVEICLRSSARFSTIEEGEEDDEAMDLTSGGGGGGNVDYYKAAFAFLVSQSNFRLAALGMYRLAKRLEDATVYEDNLARLDRKVEALAAVHNCLCLVRDGGEYPFLLWTYDDKARPPSSASASASAGGGSKKQCVVTLKRVEQELTYALAARQYLLVAGPNASPLRALSLSQAQAQPGAGDASGKLNKAAVHQVETATALLCGVGLYESAVALVKAFGLPMHDVVASLAKTYAVLRGGRADGRMVLEDGPIWNWGEVQEGGGSDDGSARREVYIRLAKTLAEDGKEAKVVAEHAEAAGWLLKDLVQGYDWAHAYELHTEAARYLLACDSFLEFPPWLTSAFTRGVDARLVKTPSRKDKGGIGDQTRALDAWLDTSSSSSPVTRVPAANTGAFLQMHVDKAMYILAPPGGSQSKVAGGRRMVVGGWLPSETVLKESLHLLGRALGYAEEMLDVATDQLLTDGPIKVWLPRRSLLALLQRTQEVLEMPGGAGGGELAGLRHQIQTGLTNLRDRKLPVFDEQLRDKERMMALMLQQPQGGGFGGGVRWQ
jgi:hypothetical protein